jgi:hypothetical protein
MKRSSTICTKLPWTLIMCSCRMNRCRKVFGQIGHLYGFSPVWILMCLARVQRCLKARPHIEHLCCAVWLEFRLLGRPRRGMWLWWARNNCSWLLNLCCSPLANCKIRSGLDVVHACPSVAWYPGWEFQNSKFSSRSNFASIDCHYPVELQTFVIGPGV